MSATPWTPGPWHRSSTHYGKAFDIGAADGDNIALIYGPAENGSDNFRANARLIEEAPAMAEALAEFVALYDTDPGTWPDADAPFLTKATAILARIRAAT